MQNVHCCLVCIVIANSISISDGEALHCEFLLSESYGAPGCSAVVAKLILPLSVTVAEVLWRLCSQRTKHGN